MTALFANQRETNFASTVAMIEDVLVELGHFLNECRIERPGTLRAWKIGKGGAEVRISLVEGDDFTHLRVSATVMTPPRTGDRMPLYAHLLRINARLCGAAFAVVSDRVVIVAERSSLDLDRSEVMDLVMRVQRYADEHAGTLVQAYGGTPGAQPDDPT